MTIEEAIEHAREVAEGCTAEDRQCAYQHDELADWLEELKAYRDTGLTPGEVERMKEYMKPFTIRDMDRFREIMRAEDSGRLAVLPCKVGDMLYEVDLPEYGVITCEVLHIGTYNGPAAHVPGNPMVSAVSVGVEVVEGHGKGSGYAVEAEDFGKSVFTTREEAEAELKEQEG